MSCKLSFSAPLVLFFCLSSAFAEKVTFSGFVTTVGTTSDYRVNDVPIHCETGITKDRVVAADKGHSVSKLACPPRVFGEALTVTGARDKAGLVSAIEVEEDSPVDLPVHGVAIIDQVLEPLKDGRLVIRADGYSLKINEQTGWDFEDQDGHKFTLSDVTPNVWIVYKGTLHPDGTVSVITAGLGHNVVSGSEDKLRKSKEFDAEHVKESDRQSALGKVFFGLNGKRIPAYRDEPMQLRISQIGNKLIPQYQRNLPESEPTKIAFRFQLVDEPKMVGSIDMPSGIILVPYQNVQKLADDSEVAELLASGIADVLQKQAYRTRPAKHALTAVGLAGDAAGFFVPGLGIATGLVTGSRLEAMQRQIVDDCGRESIALMQDAGYDIRSAPLTWWALQADRKKKTLQQTRIPEVSEYLYTVLWTTWQKTTAEEAARN